MAGTLGIATLETAVDTKGLDKGLKETKNLAEKAVGEVKKGFQTALGFGLADAVQMGVAAVKQFVTDSLDEFQTFEKGAAEVFTLMPGITQDAMDQMKADVLDFGVAVGRQSDEVLPALYQAISAGVPSENVFDFMQVASNAALGGVTDLETAVDGITSVVNAYGSEAISAQQASDVMFTAVRLGKTDFEQLSTSLFNVIPTAASLGVSFTDVSASLAALTAQGTPTSVATTQLRAAFVEASKSGSKLDEALRALHGKGFADLIKSGMTSTEVFLSLRQSTPEQEFRDLFSSVEASNAVLGLTNDTALGIIDTFGTMEGAIGATDAAAATMADTMEHLRDRVEATDEAVKIHTGGLLGPVKKAYFEWRLGMNEVTLAQFALSDALENGTISQERYNEIMRQFNRGQIDAEGITRSLTGTTEKQSKATEIATDDMAAWYGAAATAVTVMTELNDTTNNSEAVIRLAGRQVLELGGSFQMTSQEAEDLAYATGELTGHEEAMADASQTVKERLDAQAEAAELAAEQADILAEALAATEARIGGYFNAALPAVEQTGTLAEEMFNMGQNADLSAEELIILAAATGNYTAEQLEAALKTALMKENINQLVTAIQNGTTSAEGAVAALKLLETGQADTAAEAINLATEAANVNTELDGISGSAIDAATNLNAIPSEIGVHIAITSDPIPDLPNYPGGGQQPQAFASGGWTGSGGGIVHPQELVIPADVLRGGINDMMSFAQRHVPNGVMGAGGSGLTISVDARGSTNAGETEAAVRRGVQAALREAGRRADIISRNL